MCASVQRKSHSGREKETSHHRASALHQVRRMSRGMQVRCCAGAIKERAVPTLKINGIEVEIERGASVLEAARYLGIPIPTLCHEDGLAPYGGCRLCVVEVINGTRRSLQTACTYRVEEGLA